MFTKYKTPREVLASSHEHSHRKRTRTDGRPSGRLGGPSVLSLCRPSDQMLKSAGMESYNALAPYGETLNRLRRALSQRSLEIMRECDLGLRIRARSGRKTGNCRILYVTDPELLATAISTHASAALWLPIPVVLYERDEFVAILHPAEAIVRDRAALLGLQSLVARFYETLTEALESVGAPNDLERLHLEVRNGIFGCKVRPSRR
jgi:uncharacterized protein (DUF302 family)